MLDRIRFQEIQRAIFRTREEREYAGRRLCKNEPFLIIDDAIMSSLNIRSRSIVSTGRSTEASDAIIRDINFALTNGQVMLDLFNAIYGEVKHSQSTTFTKTGTEILNNEDTFELPSIPKGEVMLYLTDDYGELIKIAPSQYTVEDNVVTFIKTITQVITYTYEEEVISKVSSTIGQLGEDIIGTLEMQCTALDIITEEKIDIILRFDKVSISTSLTIDFNNSSRTSSSTIYVHALPVELQNKVNKDIMTIEIVEKPKYEEHEEELSV